MGFGGSVFGAFKFGAGEGASASSIGITKLDPSGPEPVGLNTPIKFCLVGPANFVAVGVSVLYRGNSNRYMVYELDDYAINYAPDSTIGGIGTALVAFCLYEFGGWRDIVSSVTVFGVDDAGSVFSLEALE